MKKLDSFQLKGLRKILRLDTTFINRSNTNKKVFELANAAKNPEDITGKHIKPFSLYIHEKQEVWVKHIIRSENGDPLRQCSFEPFAATPRCFPNRRVGRPRDKWAETIMKRIYVKHSYGSQEQFKMNPHVACASLRKDIMDKLI